VWGLAVTSRTHGVIAKRGDLGLGRDECVGARCDQSDPRSNRKAWRPRFGSERVCVGSKNQFIVHSQAMRRASKEEQRIQAVQTNKRPMREKTASASGGVQQSSVESETEREPHAHSPYPSPPRRVRTCAGR
jgi:hypothetical protein